MRISSWAEVSGPAMGVQADCAELTQPRSDSYHLSQSKSISRCWSRKVLPVPAAHRSGSTTVPERGCPCVHLVNREQPDLSLIVIGLVLWVGCPLSCQKRLSGNVLLQTRAQVQAEAEAGGNFQMHSLITLSTCLLPAVRLSPYCSQFCSKKNSEVSL